MRCLKKWSYRVLVIVIVLIGSLIKSDFGLSFSDGISCLPRSPSIAIQSNKSYIPQNFVFYFNSTKYFPEYPKFRYGIKYEIKEEDYKMPDVGTIPTASTCPWDCGRTYTNCSSTCGQGAQSKTFIPNGSTLFGESFNNNQLVTSNGGIFDNGENRLKTNNSQNLASHNNDAIYIPAYSSKNPNCSCLGR